MRRWGVFPHGRALGTVERDFDLHHGSLMTDDTPDLFGHTSAQGDLFGSDAASVAPGRPKVDPEMIRRRLLSMLSDVRATQDGSPWSHETTRLNQLLFPQMSNWLPQEERDQLRFEFEAELKRLNLAA